MKRLIVCFVLLCNFVWANNDNGLTYNLSMGYLEMSNQNGISYLSIGAGQAIDFGIDIVQLELETGWIGFSAEELKNRDGSYYQNVNKEYDSTGLYLDVALNIYPLKNSKPWAQPFFSTGVRGTTIIGSNDIPGMEKNLISYEIGVGIQWENGFFIKYSYEIYENKKSDLSDDDKLRSNNLIIGARVLY